MACSLSNKYCGRGHLVLGVVAAVVAGVALQRSKVEEGVAADQSLQLGRAEQVDGRAPAQPHEPRRESLELHQQSATASIHMPVLVRGMYSLEQCLMSDAHAEPCTDWTMESCGKVRMCMREASTGTL